MTKTFGLPLSLYLGKGVKPLPLTLDIECAFKHKIEVLFAEDYHFSVNIMGDGSTLHIVAKSNGQHTEHGRYVRGLTVDKIVPQLELLIVDAYNHLDHDLRAIQGDQPLHPLQAITDGPSFAASDAELLTPFTPFDTEATD